jgi:DNA-binding NarL/FixJ family response regulator
LSESYQTPIIPLFEPPLSEGLTFAKQVLGEAAYQQAWSEGSAMSLDEVVAEALSIEVASTAALQTHGPSRGDRGPVGSLTATELHVLRLLASGRTTKEIAGQLVVAVSTADRHITHIYNKLGVHNRAEATALAFKHGLI